MHNNTSMEMCLLILSHEDNFYRPQRSWAKVISSQASVCPGGVVCPEGGVICLGGGGLPGGCLVLGGSGPGEGDLVPGGWSTWGGLVLGRGVWSRGMWSTRGVWSQGVCAPGGSPIFRGGSGGLQFFGEGVSNFWGVNPIFFSIQIFLIQIFLISNFFFNSNFFF